jgi:tetratricopeptide (TPR) repeat protein
MNEEPKNIWKKSWGLPGSFLGWLVLVMSLVLFTSFLGALIVHGAGWKQDARIIIVGTFISAIGVLLFLLIRWLCCWRNFKRFLFGLACSATLIPLFYAEEDWRGWHAWQKFKHEWEAKGERFDRASVVPPTVPDDQNFALTPIVASCWEGKLDKNGHELSLPNTNVVNRLRMDIYRYSDDPKNWPTNGNWQKTTLTDLKGWQQYYRNAPGPAKTNEFPITLQPQSPAADVLLAMSKYDSAIEELRQASQMPYSRFPLNYDNEPPAAILLPHLATVKKCSQVLQLRAIAELQNGQSEQALEDIKLSLRLMDSIRTEPTLISHLVRIAILQLMLQPVWEGLAEHKWSDAQLTELDSELAKMDFLPDYGTAMRGEMVLCQIGNINYLRRHPEQLPNLSGEGDSSPPAPARILCHLIPSGWFYQNELRCAHVMLEQCLPVADTERRVVSPVAIHQVDTAVDADIVYRNPYNFLERMLLPSLGVAVRRFAYGQESVDLARVAIALERYRLAHGEYPKSLDALAPQFIVKLPHDIINGQPLYYRRTSDGQFVLYSVGWNETDDDGEVDLNENGVVNRDKGDWVWQYPAK